MPDTTVRQAARWLTQQPNLVQSAILLPTNYEGPFIAEVTALESGAPQRHLLVRPYKLLASSDWLGTNYKPQFPDVDGLAAYLDESPLGAIILSDATKGGVPDRQHDRMLRTVMSRPGSPWRPTVTLAGPNGETWRVFLHDPAPKASSEETFRFFSKTLTQKILRETKTRKVK